MTATHVVQITTDAIGHGRCIVDGKDLSNAIHGVDLAVRAGQEAVLVVHPKRGSADFDGFAEVKVAVYDYAEAVESFLGAIDAETLQTAALNRFDLDNSPTGLTKAMLTTLVEWANGRP